MMCALVREPGEVKNSSFCDFWVGRRMHSLHVGIGWGGIPPNRRGLLGRDVIPRLFFIFFIRISEIRSARARTSWCACAINIVCFSCDFLSCLHFGFGCFRFFVFLFSSFYWWCFSLLLFLSLFLWLFFSFVSFSCLFCLFLPFFSLVSFASRTLIFVPYFFWLVCDVFFSCPIRLAQFAYLLSSCCGAYIVAHFFSISYYTYIYLFLWAWNLCLSINRNKNQCGPWVCWMHRNNGSTVYIRMGYNAVEVPLQCRLNSASCPL